MQEMMQEHPDPADDSPPQSPDNEKVDCVGEIVTSNDVTSRDSQCGDATSADVRLLRTKPHSDSSENSCDKLGRTDALQSESDACWYTAASGERLSNVTEEHSVNVTSQCGENSQVGDSHQTTKASSDSDLKTTPADGQTGTHTVATV